MMTFQNISGVLQMKKRSVSTQEQSEINVTQDLEIKYRVDLKTNIQNYQMEVGLCDI